MFVALWSLLLVAIAVPTARGSSVIPPRHLGELALMSEAVVLARAGTSTTVTRGHLILTHTTFEIVEVVRGVVQAREQITIETLGGEADGHGWVVAGSPEFDEDTTYLLFLDRHLSGAWQPRMLSYGILEQAVGTDGSSLLTHIEGHHGLDLMPRPDGAMPEPIGTYYKDVLLPHLQNVSNNAGRWDQQQVMASPNLLPHIVHEASKTSAAPEPCQYMTYGGYPIRWDFENGSAVSLYAETGGDDDVSGGAEFTAVEQSVNAWTSISGVDIDFSYGGTMSYTSDCSGGAAPNDLSAYDGLVQYNDPCDEITDLSSCSGTLAVGGSFFQTGAAGRHEHRSEEWNTSVLAFVIVNNGVGACLSSNNYQRVMTHEVGHTLGFGHIPSSDGTANMNPFCCVDITTIDETCALYAYSNEAVQSAPAAITLNAPDDDTTNQPTTLTLSWDTSPDADTYEVQVSTTNSFSQIVFETDGLTGTSREVGPLSGDTEHFWRVRGINEVGTGDWSSKWSFTTEASAPTVVSLDSPDDDAENQPLSIDFTWDEEPNADTYHLQVSTDENFNNIVFENDNISEPTEEVDSFENNTSYYWRVRATNEVGTGDWSATWMLTTMPAAPEAIGLGAPADNAENQPLAIDFEWDEEPNADTYHLQVSTDENFNNLVFNNDDLEDDKRNVEGFIPNTDYFWRVRGINVTGNGPWSDVRSLKTMQIAPGAVSLKAPENGAEERPASLTLFWNPLPGSDAYHLQVSDDENFNNIIFENEEVSTTAALVSDLSSVTTYFWRVRGVNSAGPGPWAEAYSFSTALFAPGIVSLTAPEDKAHDQPSTVTFIWEAMSNVDTYHLQISTDENFNALIYDADDHTETSEALGPLAYSTMHYWRVRGINAAGEGPWSETYTLTIAVGTSIETAGSEIPDEFRLHANYPNPFNPATTLRFDVAEAMHVTLTIYDMLGRTVETLVADTLPAGQFTYVWEAGTRPSGVYIARLQAGSFVQVQQLTLLK